MFENYQSSIENVIQKLKISRNYIELEIRFRKFLNGKKVVNYFTVDRLYTLRQLFKEYPEIISDITTEMDGDIRKININGAIQYQTKTKIKNYDDTESFMRYAISTEIPLDKSDVKKFQPTHVRNITRYTYKYSDITRIDISVIDSELEFEIEYVGKNFSNLSDFSNEVEEIWMNVVGTHHIYTSSEKYQLVKKYNELISFYNNTDYIDISRSGTARDIKLNEIRKSGIVDNAITPYMVSKKIDGARTLLIVNDGNVWYCNMKGDFDLYERDNRDVSNLKFSIFEGELVDDIFIPYDCLVFNNLRIFDQYYSYRSMLYESKDFEPLPLKYAVGRIDYLFSLNVLPYVKFKNIYFLHVPDSSSSSEMSVSYQQIFDCMQYCLSKSLEDIEGDGLIFTPAYRSYFESTSSRLSSKDRIIQKHADILKWKPVEKLTIDVYVDSSFKMYTGSVDNLIPFKSPYTIDSNSLPEDSSLDMIWELKFDNNRFVFYRPRPDKKYPNSKSTLDAVIEQMVNPIQEETLLGKNLELAFRYHNNIKKQLYQRVNDLFPESKTLLDIGAGRGGDITKWSLLSNIEKIYALEPNDKNREELNRRLTYFDLNVVVIDTTGENTDKILKTISEPVDVIVLMLSLSFFWKDNYSGLLSTLTKCLKKDGCIAYLTIDGELLEDNFSKLSYPYKKDNKLIFNDIEFVKDNTNDITVSFLKSEDKIFDSQQESLVNLEKLSRDLQSFGYRLSYNAPADDELLSLPQFYYSRMFSYGIFVPDYKIIPLKLSPFNKTYTEEELETFFQHQPYNLILINTCQDKYKIFLKEYGGYFLVAQRNNMVNFSSHKILYQMQYIDGCLLTSSRTLIQAGVKLY